MPKSAHPPPVSDELSRLNELARIQETIRILIARRDEAQAEAAALDAAIAKLQEIAGGKLTHVDRPLSGPFRYAGMRVRDAIELYLKRKGSPASREELRDEVINGGAVVGMDPRYQAGNVKNSIDKNIELGRLEETADGMIGLAKGSA